VSLQKACKRSSSLCRVVVMSLPLHAVVYTPSQRLPRLRNRLYTTRILEGRQVARFLAKIRGPDHPAHDLSTARFGELLHEEHAVGAHRPPHSLGHTVHKLRTQGIAGLETRS